MPYKVWNTALDHSKAFLRRRASKMEMEPIVAGKRLRLRSSVTITNDQYAANQASLELYRGWGVLDFAEIGGEVKTSELQPKSELKIDEKKPDTEQTAVSLPEDTKTEEISVSAPTSPIIPDAPEVPAPPVEQKAEAPKMESKSVTPSKPVQQPQQKSKK